MDGDNTQYSYIVVADLFNWSLEVREIFLADALLSRKSLEGYQWYGLIGYATDQTEAYLLIEQVRPGYYRALEAHFSKAKEMRESIESKSRFIAEIDGIGFEKNNLIALFEWFFKDVEISDELSSIIRPLMDSQNLCPMELGEIIIDNMSKFDNNPEFQSLFGLREGIIKEGKKIRTSN